MLRFQVVDLIHGLLGLRVPSMSSSRRHTDIDASPSMSSAGSTQVMSPLMSENTRNDMRTRVETLVSVPRGSFTTTHTRDSLQDVASHISETLSHSAINVQSASERSIRLSLTQHQLTFDGAEEPAAGTATGTEGAATSTASPGGSYNVAIGFNSEASGPSTPSGGDGYNVSFSLGSTRPNGGRVSTILERASEDLDGSGLRKPPVTPTNGAGGAALEDGGYGVFDGAQEGAAPEGLDTGGYGVFENEGGDSAGGGSGNGGNGGGLGNNDGDGYGVFNDEPSVPLDPQPPSTTVLIEASGAPPLPPATTTAQRKESSRRSGYGDFEDLSSPAAASTSTASASTTAASAASAAPPPAPPSPLSAATSSPTAVRPLAKKRSVVSTMFDPMDVEGAVPVSDADDAAFSTTERKEEAVEANASGGPVGSNAAAREDQRRFRQLHRLMMSAMKGRWSPDRPVPLCPDALTSFMRTCPEEESRRLNGNVREATRVLVHDVVPAFAKVLLAKPAEDLMFLDLALELHGHGINLRHMGLLRSCIPASDRASEQAKVLGCASVCVRVCVCGSVCVRVPSASLGVNFRLRRLRPAGA